MSERTAEQWRNLAAAATLPVEAWIDGGWTPAGDGEAIERRSPIDGRVLGLVGAGSAADVDRAVAAARRAWKENAWAGCAPSLRKAVLLRFAELLDERADDLALAATLEMGKPILDALREVEAAAACFAYYAEAQDKVFGEVAPTGLDAFATVTREPVGVVGAVTPWNFPVLMPSWKLAPALAAGNSVVLKPAEQSPFTALLLGRIGTEAGLPEGVLNVVPGLGEVAGKALGLHQGVDAIAFTGSTAVGKLFLGYSGASNMKAVWLECGGKSPSIVLADAPDLSRAAEVAAESIFLNAGQACNASSRLVLDAAIAEEFLAAVVAASAAWAPSDPFEPASKMGPVVDESQMRRVLGYVERSREEGVEVLAGGRMALPESGGCFVEPTVLLAPHSDVSAAREEIFGPVLTALKVADLKEGLEVANATEYGLAASIWTSDLRKALRTARALEAGNVYVNCYDKGDLSMPFGGFGASGIGVDKSLHALEKYTRMKSTWIEL